MTLSDRALYGIERIYRQAKYILAIVALALTLLLLNSALNHAFETTAALALSLVFIGGLRWYLTIDTCSLVLSVLMWFLTIMASYFAWNFSGIWDSAIFGYTGILIFSTLIGSRVLVFSVAFYMVASIYGIQYATQIELIEPKVSFDIATAGWQKANNMAVFVLLYSFLLDFIIRQSRRASRRFFELKSDYQHFIEETQAASQKHKTTGLPNDLACEKKLTALLQKEGTQKLIALYVVDIDNLSSISSTLGHEVSNKVISTFADMAQQKLSLSLFHTATSQLSLICQASDYEKLEAIIHDFAMLSNKPVYVEENELHLSFTIGAALAPIDGHHYETLRKKALIALNAADNRHWVNYFEPAMEANLKNIVGLTQRLKQAIANDEFELYYQPKVSLVTDEVVGAEALIRWRDSDGTMIRPDEFIPVAETSGLINAIGRWALQRGCMDCKHWNTDLGLTVPVSINLSPVQFSNNDLPKLISLALHHSGLPASLLDLEITESMVLEDDQEVEVQIQNIKRLGASFSIDDFGSGYSNLGYISKFNASSLKIDRMFIKDITGNSQNRYLVDAIIEISRVFKMNTIAEGIEDEATLTLLRSLGCEVGQGYFWSKPLPYDEFVQYLESHATQYQHYAPLTVIKTVTK